MLELIDLSGLKVVEAFPEIGVSHTLYKCVRK